MCYFSFGALCNLKNFGQLNLWMLVSFIILFKIDLYKDNHVHVCIRR